MSDKKINVAVIGYGLSAKVFHIPFFQLVPQFNLHTIVQRSPSSSSSSAPADFPSLNHVTSPDAVLADPAVDLVAILTPPNTHFDLATRCLEAGKHVLVEKPFVPTSAEASKLAALAESKNLVLCVYQNRRWDSDFLTLKALLANDTLGRLVELDTHFDRYRPARPEGTWKASLGMDAGGGALYDLGSHLIDQVYALFGMPGTVYGKLVNQRDGKVDAAEEDPDSVFATLTWPGTGLIVNVRIGVMCVSSPQPRFWARGTKGSFVKTGLDPQEGQLRGGMKASDAGFGVEADANAAGTLTTVAADGSFETRRHETARPVTYVKLFEELARAIESGDRGVVPVKPTEARDVLKILEAVRESAREGKEVKMA